MNGNFAWIYNPNIYGGQKRALHRYYTFTHTGAGKSNPKSSEREAGAPNCWAVSIPFTFFWDRIFLSLVSRLSSNSVILHHPLSCFGYKSVPSLQIPHILYLTIFWLFEKAIFKWHQQRSMSTLLLANEVQKAHVNSNIPQESGMVPVVTQKKFKQSHWDSFVIGMHSTRQN